MNIGSVEFHSAAIPLSKATEVVRAGRFTPVVCSDDDQSTFSDSKPYVDKALKDAGLKIAEKKKRRKQKKWKKPKDKPSRPLSAYNLFFQAQRSQMLGADAPSAALEDLKKRVHCKTHGKIGFAEMARAIGAKWKALEPEKKKVYEDQARKEKLRYTAELASWKDAQKEKIVEVDQNGLDAIATAAMASDPIEDSHQLLPAASSPQFVQPKPSNALRMAMAADGAHRRHLAMLQRRPNDLDYIRALQDRQVDTARLLGLSRLESSLLKYPSAAEASANAILQQFQGLAPMGTTRSLSSASQRLLEAERLSELAAASSYPANLAAIRQYQFMTSAFSNDLSLCR